MEHELVRVLERTLKRASRKPGQHYPFWWVQVEDKKQSYLWVGGKPIPRNRKISPGFGRRQLEKFSLPIQGARISSGTVSWVGGHFEFHVLRRKMSGPRIRKMLHLFMKREGLKRWLREAVVVEGEWDEEPNEPEVEAAAEPATEDPGPQ